MLHRAKSSGMRRTAGLKPVFILDALRGAEAPLFHGAAWDRGFLLMAFLVSAKGSGRGRPINVRPGVWSQSQNQSQHQRQRTGVSVPHEQKQHQRQERC
jgi:hypothetical protein